MLSWFPPRPPPFFSNIPSLERLGRDVERAAKRVLAQGKSVVRATAASDDTRLRDAPTTSPRAYQRPLSIVPDRRIRYVLVRCRQSARSFVQVVNAAGQRHRRSSGITVFPAPKSRLQVRRRRRARTSCLRRHQVPAARSRSCRESTKSRFEPSPEIWLVICAWNAGSDRPRAG